MTTPAHEVHVPVIECTTTEADDRAAHAAGTCRWDCWLCENEAKETRAEVISLGLEPTVELLAAIEVGRQQSLIL